MQAPPPPPSEDKPPSVERLPVAAATTETPSVVEPPSVEPVFDDARIDWTQNGVMRVIGRMSGTMTSTAYWRGGVRVDERKGTYEFDCSGMIDWVLRKSAPMARASSAAGLDHRPLASDFYRRIARAPFDREEGGWRQVAKLEDAAPGDVIAWIKPPIIP